MDITKNVMMLMTVILALTLLFVPFASAESVVRELPTSAENGDNFNVNLVIDNIEVGAVMETIPEGCSYVSCSCPEEQVNISGQNLIISIINTEEVTYTVKASKTGTHSFMGVWENFVDETEGTIDSSDIKVISKYNDDGGGDDDDSVSASPGSISTDSEGIVSDLAEINSKDGKGQIIIANGTHALTKSGNVLLDVNIEPVKSGDLPPTESGAQYSFADRSYKCSPAGATFDPPIELVFNLTAEEWNGIGDDKMFVIRWFNPDTDSWEDLETKVDKDKHTVTALVSHFSVYALFEQTVLKTTDTKSGQEVKTDATTKADITSSPSGQVTTSATKNPGEKVTAAATGNAPQTEESSGGSVLLFAGILIVLGIVGGALYLSSVKEGGKGDGRQ